MANNLSLYPTTFPISIPQEAGGAPPRPMRPRGELCPDVTISALPVTPPSTPERVTIKYDGGLAAHRRRQSDGETRQGVSGRRALDPAVRQSYPKLSRNTTHEPSARSALPPTALREHLSRVGYDPRLLSSQKPAAKDSTGGSPKRTAGNKITGLRLRISSPVEAQISVGSPTVMRPEVSRTIRAVSATTRHEPAPEQDGKVSKRLFSAPSFQIHELSTSSATSSINQLTRKPIPLRLRPVSPTLPDLGVFGTPTSPPSDLFPSSLSPPSSCRVSDPEPQSGWDTDDDDDEKSTLMWRMKSSLHLPGKTFSFGSPSEKRPALTTRRRGSSFTDKFRGAVLCGCGERR